MGKNWQENGCNSRKKAIKNPRGRRNRKVNDERGNKGQNKRSGMWELRNGRQG